MDSNPNRLLSKQPTNKRISIFTKKEFRWMGFSFEWEFFFVCYINLFFFFFFYEDKSMGAWIGWKWVRRPKTIKWTSWSWKISIISIVCLYVRNGKKFEWINTLLLSFAGFFGPVSLYHLPLYFLHTFKMIWMIFLFKCFIFMCFV